MQTLGPLNMRLIFAISMMRSQERARSEVQHFVRPVFISFIDLCADVRALKMRVIFDIGLMRLRQQAPSADHNFVPHCLVPTIDLYANVGALNMSRDFWHQYDAISGADGNWSPTFYATQFHSCDTALCKCSGL